MKTIIEIGANTGSDTERFARDAMVYAFEPNPLLYPVLVEKFKSYSNVIIIPMAVDIKSGIADFNVCDFGDFGLGSLRDWHPNLRNTEPGQHPIFQTDFSRKQKVLTITLSDFLNVWDIKKVDYLWIDAQGNDLNCIKSLCPHEISRVQQGRCECTYKLPLYENSEHINNYEECIYLLNAFGFQTKIDYVHANETEVDIAFWR